MNICNAREVFSAQYKRTCSPLHPVRPILLELVTGSSELLGDDIAQVHQVVEALLQSFEGGRCVWREVHRSAS